LELGTSVHHIDETECGSWPTPTTTGNEFSPSMQKWAGHRRMMATLTSRERQPSKPDRPSAQAWDELLSTTLPTPTAKLYGYNKGGAAGRVGKERPSLESLIGGVSIALREWMMGWPIGWTALESLGTDRFRMWLGSRPAYWAGEGRAA
jgi:hypothetical protein